MPGYRTKWKYLINFDFVLFITVNDDTTRKNEINGPIQSAIQQHKKEYIGIKC